MLNKKYFYPTEVKKTQDLSIIDILCPVEERFSIILENYYPLDLFMTPSDTDEFVAGFLYNNLLIKSLDDIISIRLCNSNKFHIYIKDKENSNKIKNRHIKELLQNRTMAWGDIVPLRAKNNLSLSDIQKIVVAKKDLDRIDSIAINIPNIDIYNLQFNEIKKISDVNNETILDKTIGWHLLNNNKNTILFIDNLIVSMRDMQKLYSIPTSLIITNEIPTRSAILFAKKAGMALIINQPQERQFIVDTNKLLS